MSDETAAVHGDYLCGPAEAQHRYDPRIWPWIEAHHEIDWEDKCRAFVLSAVTFISSTAETDSDGMHGSA